VQLVTAISDLIKAVAALGWPIVAGLAVLLFRGDLGSLLKRVKHAKGAGLELDLTESIEEVRESVAQAAAEIPQALPAPFEPAPAEQGSQIVIPLEGDLIDAKVRAILEEAGRSPILGVMLLSVELERAAVQVAAATGHSPHAVNPASVLPTHLGASYRGFRQIRNQVVHGQRVADEIAIKAIDVGIDLLRAILSLPRNINVVSRTGLVLFSDAECTNERPGVIGIIVESTPPEGPPLHHVLPTKITTYFPGMRVTLEWDMEHVWDATWYLDPDTNCPTQAWLSAAEFTGRNLATL